MALPINFGDDVDSQFKKYTVSVVHWPLSIQGSVARPGGKVVADFIPVYPIDIDYRVSILDRTVKDILEIRIRHDVMVWQDAYITATYRYTFN